MNDRVKCGCCNGTGYVNVMSGVVKVDTPINTVNWHQIIGPMQPCHSFTLETGKPDCDEPTIVEVKP